MLSTLANSHDATTISAPYRVGNFQQGQTRGDVSKEWFARPHDQRFLSLTDLLAHVSRRAEHTVENRVDSRSIEFTAPPIKSRDDLHRLFLSDDGKTLVTPSHWSFGQLAGLAGAPARYLRTLPSTITADALTYGLRYNRSAERVKLYRTEEQLLAATGPDYGRIFDREIVQAVMNFAGDGTGRDGRWKIPGQLNWQSGSEHWYDPEAPITMESTTLYASDRDCFIFLVDDRNPIEIGRLPSGNPDLVFRGVIISNSEVGSATASVRSFLLRGVCQNRCIWGSMGFEEISIRHTKSAPDRWIEEARPALLSYAEGGTKSILEGVQKAREAKVAADDEAMLDFLQERSFSRKASLAMMEAHLRDEGHPVRSVWDAAQAITAHARAVPFQDDRIAVEWEAKKLLDKVA